MSWVLVSQSHRTVIKCEFIQIIKPYYSRNAFAVGYVDRCNYTVNERQFYSKSKAGGASETIAKLSIFVRILNQSESGLFIDF